MRLVATDDIDSDCAGGPRDDAAEALLRRVQSEYAEMPGLSLTLTQAQRLWGLSRQECEAVLDRLVERQVLRRTRRGAFVVR